ncbi:ATP-binding protein [Sphaerochaeta sp.]|uniref:ATP-binding protein n=1 Tax=Sphaerochaeta sp. TaxID=1972642 RepID=UPI002FC6F278
MHQILILSGKGGTGKTTVASSFIALSKAKASADCDVDAPNLHLVMGSFEQEQDHGYFGLEKAVIDGKKCILCNRCFAVCRFDAIKPGKPYQIDAMACEGCTYCSHVCPTDAISTIPFQAGTTKLFHRRDAYFSTATLRMGSGNTGKLVSEVKRRLKDAAEKTEVAILDGSPGLGCPVIASLTGVDLALMVAEPSVSGLSDLERVVASARQLQVPVAVGVNKADMNKKMSAQIELYCFKEGIPFLGTIPYDPTVLEAINNAQVLVSYDCPASAAVKAIYERTLLVLKEMHIQ